MLVKRQVECQHPGERYSRARLNAEGMAGISHGRKSVVCPKNQTES
jgi:hypothetical protein